MKFIFYCIGSFLCLNAIVRTPPPIESGRGTVLVFAVSKEEVIIGADSRITSFDEKQHDDNDCKIATFDGRLIFASAGVRRFDSAPLVRIAWDSHAIALSAFHSDYAQPHSGAGGTVREVAEKWGALGAELLGKAATPDARGFARAFNLKTSAIAQGLFAGMAPDNITPEIYVVTISLVMPSYHTAASVNFDIQRRGPGAPVSMGALGTVELFDEIMNQKTSRGKSLFAESQGAVAGKSPTDRTVLTMIKMIEWTIIYGPHDVGGPVDVVALDRTGIKWVQRKPSCVPPK